MKGCLIHNGITHYLFPSGTPGSSLVHVFLTATVKRQAIDTTWKVRVPVCNVERVNIEQQYAPRSLESDQESRSPYQGAKQPVFLDKRKRYDLVCLRPLLDIGFHAGLEYEVPETNGETVERACMRHPIIITNYIFWA